MKYQSFNTQSNKLSKSFNKKETNRKDLDALETVNTNFRSINFNKNINVITLVDEDLITTSQNNYSIIFTNMPDWAVTMAKPFYFFSAENGLDFSSIVDNLSTAFANGTLKLNDASLIRWNVQHWWSKLGENTYKFFLRTNVNIRYVSTLSQVGFSTTFLPIYFSVKLQFINNRDYYEVQ